MMILEFRKCQQGDGGRAEDVCLPQVHLRPRGPRPATGHGLRAADAAVQPGSAAAAALRPAEEAALEWLLKRLREAEKAVPPTEEPEVVEMGSAA